MPLGLLALAAAVLAIGSSGATFAAEPPPMSDPIVLDHGFRYPTYPYIPTRSTVAVGEGAVFFAYEGNGGGFGSLHDPSGGRVGANLVDLFAGQDHMSTFDCADQDSVGWKVAYIGGEGSYGQNRVMRVRNLHATTLEPTGPDLHLAAETSEMRCPVIVKYRGGHLVLWIDGTDLIGTRVTFDMQRIDEAPYGISGAAVWVAAAMSDSGGLVVWKGPGDEPLIGLHLDADAVPDGWPTTIGSNSYAPMFDVAPLGAGWLVAGQHSDKLDLHLLDASGAPVSMRRMNTGLWDSPVAVASSGPVALVLWGNIQCTHVDANGETIGGVRLDDLENVSYDTHLFSDPRSFACAWTGETFALLWHEFGQLVTAKGQVMPPDPQGRGLGMARAADPGYGEAAVQAQWVAERGQAWVPEPLLVCQASRPWVAGLRTVGDRTISVLGDGATSLWLHTFQLDTTGDVVGGPTRIRTPAYEASCWVWECDMSYIGGTQARPWGGDVVCMYEYTDYHSSEWYTHHSSVLELERVNLLGEPVLHAAVPVYEGEDFISAAGSDFAAREEDALVVFGTWNNAYGWGKAELLSASGQRIRQWSIAGDSAIAAITTVPLDDGYLIVWSQGEPEGWILRTTVLDPTLPGTEITGARLLGPGWHAGGCTLVPGLDQSLCLFVGGPGEDPAENRLYAVRFDTAGRLLDPQPILLTPDTCRYCDPAGVWDSNHYFLAWKRWTAEEGSSMYGSRIGRNGVVVDPTPFPLASSAWNPTLSSDSLGNVTLAYGNTIRMIRDLVPLELQDPIFPDDDAEAAGDLRIGDVTPNPARGEVRLALKLPTGITARVAVHDAAGRRLHVAEIAGPFVGAAPVWDGRLEAGRRAPAGVYFLRVEVGARGESRKAFLLR